MKGTLFSADFVTDEMSNLRLLELNTDTAFVSVGLYNHFDFTSFFNLLSTNNITHLVVIYKPMQYNFVEHLQNQVDASATFITNFEKIRENADSIYPTSVTDASDKFILRLAYDENAVFDSTYCKDRINVLKLFNENTASLNVPEMYVSSSDGIINTLTSSLNNNIQTPDVVTKAFTHTTNPMDFLKFDRAGYYHSSSAEMITDFVDNYLDTDALYAEKYHLSPTTLSDGVVKSIRVFSVVYGSNLDTIQLGAYKIESMFDLPQSITGSSEGLYGYNDGITYQIPLKHYFEYTTNFMKETGFEGLLDVEYYKKVDDSYESIASASISGSVKSYYVSGSPNTDSSELYASWSHSGNTLDGSFVTESVINMVESASFNYPGLMEINLSNDDSIYCSTQKTFLTYNTSSNEFSYKKAFELTASADFLTNESGSPVPISSSNYAILDSDNHISFVRIDVEDTDTYFVSSSEAVVTHNAPCFVAGTPIHTEDGIKNIEDVKVGDKVITYNHNNDTAEYKEVLSILVKENEHVVTYVFENGTELTGTPDHPLFVNGKGYASYSPQATKEDSNLDVEQILIGDEVLHLDGYGVTITDIIEDENTHTVYNLDKVADNHNFYAWDFLAHNRFQTCFAAGTQIEMSDGSEKNIEDVVVGDEVLGWDGEDIGVGTVSAIDHRHTVGSHSDACKSLGDEPSLYTLIGVENDWGIEFTPEHPFLTKEGWKSLVPDPNQEPYATQQEPKVLKVGDFVNCGGPNDWEEIKEIKVVRSNPEEKVYNITVDGLHSYIANGLVVHNK